MAMNSGDFESQGARRAREDWVAGARVGHKSPWEHYGGWQAEARRKGYEKAMKRLCGDPDAKMELVLTDTNAGRLFRPGQAGAQKMPTHPVTDTTSFADGPDTTGWPPAAAEHVSQLLILCNSPATSPERYARIARKLCVLERRHSPAPPPVEFH